jgi:hypothetical protein
MKLRMSWAVMAFLILAGLIAHIFASSSLFADVDAHTQAKLSSTLVSTSETNTHKGETTREQNTYAFMREMQGGEKSAEAIQSEMNLIAGETKPISWSGRYIKGSYKLTQIISHVQNLDNNFELMYTHTLPDKKKSEDTVTNYTGRLLEADENTMNSSIVFSKFIRVKKGIPTFDENTRAQYFFSLKPQLFRSSFSLREPAGTYQMAPVREGAFDPLAILTSANSNFEEIGEYQYEVQAGEARYIVSVTPRITEIETLTIETDIREVNSLITNSFILVYEPQ